MGSDEAQAEVVLEEQIDEGPGSGGDQRPDRQDGALGAERQVRFIFPFPNQGGQDGVNRKAECQQKG